MHTRTFRLFVSSTFSDFTEERKLLQTVVFRKIKEYCQDKQLVFQPIDLRWGVTDEASNDQKTLELCLDEVQTSKLHPYPNFLIMLGDRYGTVILPYTIEECEFKKIYKKVQNKDDRNLLRNWYKLDKNQVPASYIIKSRKDASESEDGIDYTDRKNWKPINNRLLKILQTAVEKTNIEEIKKKKYFASATEAEVIEGIFKYLNQTPFQEKLLEEDDTLVSKDYEHVYAYVRNIKSIKPKKNLNPIEYKKHEKRFIDEDLINIKNVKKEIEKSLNKETNIYEANVDLLNTETDENGKLAYYYEELNNSKENFVSKMIEYLEKSVDTFITKIEEDTKDKCDEEIKIQNEAFEQERFKGDKLKLFLGREKSLNAIKDYIESDNKQPFVLYGRSGLGKSSVMAKAVQIVLGNKINGKYENEDKVIYKFVGSTASLNDSPSILISILRELGIDEEIKTIKDPQTGQEKNEDIEEFYSRVNNHLTTNIKDEKVIFIDAIDQVSNEDKFIWLPNELPSNLRIVISALNHESYDDTRYFKNLKTKTNNLYELEPFEDPKALLVSKLKRYDRTITEDQMKRVLLQKDSSSPLYITVAVEELRHCTHNSTEKLASSQKEIISEYISNLHTKFHHDKELIKRVFSYIYLADGLSESELLEILNTDEDFIKQIAPDTHHKKETQELPIVIWARLHFQIKQFLKLEEQDGYETMKFFHREFINIVSNQKNIREYNLRLVALLEDIVLKNKAITYSQNRWIDLYVISLNKLSLNFYSYGEYIDSTTYAKKAITILENKYKEKGSWSYLYVQSLINFSLSHIVIGDTMYAIKVFLGKAIIISQDMYRENKEFAELYFYSLLAMGRAYNDIGFEDERDELFNQAYLLAEEMYNKSQEFWESKYRMILNIISEE